MFLKKNEKIAGGLVGLSGACRGSGAGVCFPPEFVGRETSNENTCEFVCGGGRDVDEGGGCGRSGSGGVCPRPEEGGGGGGYRSGEVRGEVGTRRRFRK